MLTPIPTGNTAVDTWTDGGFRLGNLVVLVGDLASPIATQWLCAGRPESHLIDCHYWSTDLAAEDARKLKRYCRDKGRVAFVLVEDARREEQTPPSIIDIPEALEVADLAFVVRNGRIACVHNRNGARGSAPFSMED